MTGLLVGSAGESIVDVQYVDRPPYFANVFFGALGAPATRGRLGAYEVVAIDPDGDTIDVDVEGTLPDWIRFDDELRKFTWIFPCDGDSSFFTTLTATAGRYRARIGFHVSLGNDAECPPE